MAKRKLQIQYFERAIEQTTCSICRYYLKTGEKDGFCLKRITKTADTYRCANYSAGEPLTSLTPKQKEKLLRKFVEFEIYVKSVEETYKTFKELIAVIFDDGERYGKYKVVNKEVERTQLDTQKIYKLLETLPNRSDYLKTVRYRFTRVIDVEEQPKR